jgi:hypothetical protein
MITKRTTLGSSNFETDINKYLIGCVIKDKRFKIILIASTFKKNFNFANKHHTKRYVYYLIS